MKTNINLLPADISGTSQAAQLARLLTNITTGLVVLFLIAALGAGGYMLYLSGQINSAKDKQSELTQSIQSLEEVEQQYALVRDRLDKIKPIFSEASTVDYSSEFRNLAVAVPGNTLVSEAELNKDNIKLTYYVGSSSELGNLFSKFSNTQFGKIILESFNFNPLVGYIVSLDIFVY